MDVLWEIVLTGAGLPVLSKPGTFFPAGGGPEERRKAHACLRVVRFGGGMFPPAGAGGAAPLFFA